MAEGREQGEGAFRPSGIVKGPSEICCAFHGVNIPPGLNKKSKTFNWAPRCGIFDPERRDLRFASVPISGSSLRFDRRGKLEDKPGYRVKVRGRDIAT